MRVVDERVVDAEAVLEDAGRALRAVLSQPRGEQRAVRGPGGMDRLRRRRVIEVGEETGGHAAGDAERARRRVRCQPAEARGRSRGAEDPADRSRVEAALVEGAGRRHADASRDLVACDHGRQELATARPAGLCERDGRRHDHRRHVRDRLGVGVVEVEPMAEHRVREGGVRRREPRLQPDHRGVWLAAQLGHRRATLGGDPQAVRGEAAADHVEHVQLRRLDDRRRDRIEVELERPRCEPLCGLHTVHSSVVPGKLRSACGAVRL